MDPALVRVTIRQGRLTAVFEQDPDDPFQPPRVVDPSEHWTGLKAPARASLLNRATRHIIQALWDQQRLTRDQAALASRLYRC